MSSHSQRALPPMELNRVDGVRDRQPEPVNEVDTLGLSNIPLHMAKARVGAIVKAGIGNETVKRFGDKGLMSNVMSGERVPEYLARIWSDPSARVRFGRAWLAGGKIRVRTVLEWDEEEIA